jgi:hypothetical protein
MVHQAKDAATVTTMAVQLDPGDPVQRKLRGLWRRQQHYVHLNGLAAVLLAAALLLAAAFLLDWNLWLPGETRFVLLLVVLSVLAWLAYIRWWSRLRPYNARSAALQIEQHYADHDSSLIAYLQLSEGGDGSSQLARAARQQGAIRAEPWQINPLVSFRNLRRPALTAMAAWVLMLAAAAVWPQTARAFATRLLNPFSTQVYPTRTQLTLTDTEHWTPRGGSVVLTSHVHGSIPPQGTLDIRRHDVNTWESIRLDVDDQHRLSHQLVVGDGDLIYRFRAGDGRSEQGRIHIVSPPRIVDTELTLQFPRYTGMPPRTQDHFAVRVVEGSSIRWRLTLDRPVATAALVPMDDQGEPKEAVAFDLDADGRTLTLAMPVRTIDYRLRWTVPFGRSGGQMMFEDPVHRRLEAVPDAPPVVHLSQPADRNLLATAGLVLPLQFRASDDFGLTEAWIVYRVGDEDEEGRIPIGELSGRLVSNATFTWSLSQTLAPLSSPTTVEFTIEVADNRGRPHQFQRARAEPWRTIQVVSEEALLRHLAERQLESLKRVGHVRQQTGESLDQVNRLQQAVSDITVAPNSGDAP